MRVTNQMLNASAKKAGIPIQRSSLLDFINNKDYQVNPLQSDSIVSAGKTKYEKLEEAADILSKQIEKVSSKKTDNIFDSAKEKNDNTELVKEAESMAENYNGLLECIQHIPGTLNSFYAKSLKDAAAANADELKKLGISISKNGTLTVDKDKLKTADYEVFENVMRKDSGFMAKMSSVSKKIYDNAKTNLESISSNYTSKGSFNDIYKSKYNFMG